MKTVAFLDVLGFSNHVYEDLNQTEKIVKDINELLAVKISNDINARKITDDNLYKELIDSYTFDAVDFILPVSDSIFLAGNNSQRMILQISNFLCRILEFTLSRFLNNNDCFPVIMRGGIDYGETKIINSFIYNQNCKKCELNNSFNMIGIPVVEAVKLEEMHNKGPKLFLTENVVDELDEDEKKFVSDEDNKKYFLWPKSFFIKNNLFNDFKSEFRQRCKYNLRPIIELYCKYKNKEKVVRHYESLICMTIEAFSKIYLMLPDEQEENKQIAQDELKEIITNADLTKSERETFLNSICC